MKQYSVTGMSCAACSARVEKAVSAVPGVTSCAVNLLTHSMGVEGTAGDDAIIQAVKKAGYGASPVSGEKPTGQPTADPLADTETPRLKRRLFASLGFLAVLMYLSMGHVMWHWPLPDSLAGNPAALGLTQLLLAGIVMVINQKFFRQRLYRSPARRAQYGHTGGNGIGGGIRLQHMGSVYHNSGTDAWRYRNRHGNASRSVF